MTNVTAIVVTFDSAVVLAACLSALNGQVDRIVVVDNASNDETVALATQAGAVVIRNSQNCGYGIANNRGIEAASEATWCLIVNPDVTLQPNCVAHLVAAANRRPNAAILVPRLIEPDGRVFFRESSVLSGTPPIMPAAGVCPDDDGPIAFASGACMLVKRDRFLELGGFDQNIFLFYEDDDLSLRMRKAGYDIVYVHAAEALHLRGRSSVARPGALYQQRFHLAWSRSYILRKYGLRTNALATVAVSSLKLLFARLRGKSNLIERHAGSLSGAWAALWRRPHPATRKSA